MLYFILDWREMIEKIEEKRKELNIWERNQTFDPFYFNIVSAVYFLLKMFL
jgi:hypothetical protein